MKKRNVETYTYGKVLRNFIKLQNNLNARFNAETFAWRWRSNYQALLSFNALRAFAKQAQSSDYDPDSKDVRAEAMRKYIADSTMAVLEVFVDVYKILNLREKLGIIDETNAHLLEEMRKSEQFEDIVKILCRESNISLIAEAMDFDNLSAFDKVLQIKALDDDDLVILRRIFPLFEVEKSENKLYEGEYNHYNVKVDEEFIARQIGKWQNGCKDDIEKSYEEAAKFLDNYSFIDSALFERISKSVDHTESCDKKELLKKFYQSR